VFQLVLTYVVWILCILAVQGNEVIWHNYPPAVVALMVAVILHMLYIMAQFIFPRHWIFSAINIIIATIFFMCFTIATVIPVTVLRHHHRYCPPGYELSGDCRGRLKGTYGMAYALIVSDLLYIGFICGLVWENSATFRTPYGLLPDKRRPVADKPSGPAAV
jgi:hypothetical protein